MWGMQKLSKTRRRSEGILSIRQVSSTQLSAIFATDFPGYLAYKVLGAVAVLHYLLEFQYKTPVIFNFISETSMLCHEKYLRKNSGQN